MESLYDICVSVWGPLLVMEYAIFSPLTPGFHHHITCVVDPLHKERETISDHSVRHVSVMHHTMYTHFLPGASESNFPGKSTRTHRYSWIPAITKPLKEFLGWRRSLSVSDCLPLTWFCLVWCVVCLPQSCWPASLIPSLPLSCKLLRSKQSQQISFLWAWKKSLS